MSGHNSYPSPDGVAVVEAATEIVGAAAAQHEATTQQPNGLVTRVVKGVAHIAAEGASLVVESVGLGIKGTAAVLSLQQFGEGTLAIDTVAQHQEAGLKGRSGRQLVSSGSDWTRVKDRRQFRS